MPGAAQVKNRKIEKKTEEINSFGGLHSAQNSKEGNTVEKTVVLLKRSI